MGRHNSKWMLGVGTGSLGVTPQLCSFRNQSGQMEPMQGYKLSKPTPSSVPPPVSLKLDDLLQSVPPAADQVEEPLGSILLQNSVLPFFRRLDAGLHHLQDWGPCELRRSKTQDSLAGWPASLALCVASLFLSWNSFSFSSSSIPAF